MEPVHWIAIASIITSGITIAIGALGAALRRRNCCCLRYEGDCAAAR